MLYVSHLLPDHEMKEIIEKTGMGIESIYFSIAENLDRLADSIFAYKKRLQYIGTDNLIMHGPFLDLNPMSYDKEIRKVTMLRYNQAYTAATELGAKKIVYHTCFYPNSCFLMGWADRVSDFYHEFMKDKKEIEIVMENMFDPVWQPLVEVTEKINADNFHLCLDIGHANCFSKIDVMEWVTHLVDQTSHIHIHDNLGDRDAHLGIGKGSICWEQIFKLIQKDMTITIECNDKESVELSYNKVLELLEI